ncbi:hypothetical protein COLO4_38443 [Corchorus olitorius]|uniref:Uncharacterized protein n=1 Tax=Corchorus olitorius TaxID=93759 RepID=A0A1R3FV26_9ROSI|nr:hypothetical protein COLO4_38443 [Corchorus olitorius]
MASFLPSYVIIRPCCFKQYYTRPQALQVRAQSFRDHEGRSSNSVDANLGVLRERIEQVKIKERVERYNNGWNYRSPGYNYKLKRELELSQFFELIELI